MNIHHPADGCRIGIIGAGLGGLQIARELMTLPGKIILWDQGPFFRLHHEGQDRQIHPGDRRERGWPAVAHAWGHLSGLKHRVGGRSLCWHGQLLPIEDYALAAWPACWRARLENQYDRLISTLCERDAQSATGSSGWASAGLQPVRQAARLTADEAGVVRALSAYSPLVAAREQANLRIVPKSQITHVAPCAGGVRVFQQDAAPVDVDKLVLAAGAIGNAAILASSLGRQLRVPLCDHICVGAVVSFRSDTPVSPRILGEGALLGYVALPELQANLFFQELPPAGDGTRTIDAWVLAEQEPEAASSLVCAPRPHGGAGLAIAPRLSEADAARGAAALERVIAIFASVLGMPSGRANFGTEADAITHARANPGIVACYERPLGSVDHEACTHAIGTMCLDDLSVPGLPGVYLSGPGIFPRAGAANPGLAILAVANWLAASIKSQV